MSDTTECRMVTGGEIADELSDAFPDIPTSKGATRSSHHPPGDLTR